MKTMTITAKHCVIEGFMTEDDVEFIEIKQKAKDIAKSLEKQSFLENGKRCDNKVVSIDYREDEMKAVINYESVLNSFLN